MSSNFLKTAKKQNFKIGDENMIVERKPLIINSKIQSVMITTEKTYTKQKNGNADIEPIKMKDIKAFVEGNIEQFVGGKSKRIQINVLTDQGWRGGEHAFNSSQFDEDSWFVRENAYAGYTAKSDSIYACQILIF